VIFTKFSGKVARGAWENPLDLGSNQHPVTLALG